jgi:hypothetical protein
MNGSSQRSAIPGYSRPQPTAGARETAIYWAERAKQPPCTRSVPVAAAAPRW